MIKNGFCLVLLGVFAFYNVNAQNVYYFNNQPDIVLKTSFSNGDADQNSIAWNEHNYKYYTATIDSLSSKIETFDAMGQSMGIDSFDILVMGMWYNNTLDFLEAYNSADNSCYSFFINDQGEFENTDVSMELESLEEEGTIVFPVYNIRKDVFAYYEPVAGIIIEVEPLSGEILNYTPVTLEADKNHIAQQQLLYTDIETSPYALVDTVDKLLYLMDENGFVIYTVNLPQTDYSPSCFGFVNGALWLFDGVGKSWNGYAIQY